MDLLAWRLDPTLLGTLFTTALLYALAIGPFRSRIAPGERFPLRYAIVFFSALFLVYLAEGSPLHDLAENYLLSAHMVQHLLIAYVVPPMLIWGMPNWLLRPLLLNPVIKPIAKFLIRPIIAIFIFSFFFSMWHFPFFYDGALSNPFIHHIEHIFFVVISLVVWWPVMSPLEELPPLHFGPRILYLFVLPLIQTGVFAIITFSDQVLYMTYANSPVRFFDLHPLSDQRWAGVVMKIGGIFAFGAPLVAAFLVWAQRDAAGTLPKRPKQAEQKQHPINKALSKKSVQDA